MKTYIHYINENTLKNIFILIMEDDVSGIKEYLKTKHTFPIIMVNNVDLTLFSYAVIYSNIEVTQLFVDAGCDINIKIDHDNNNVLKAALDEDKFEMFLYLIDIGVDPYHKNYKGSTIFDYMFDDEIEELEKLSPGFKRKYLKEQNRKKFNL